MLTAFHIDIIRQFEIQKQHLDSIVREYLLEDAEEDGKHEPDQKFIVEVVHKQYMTANDEEDDDFNEQYL